MKRELTKQITNALIFDEKFHKNSISQPSSFILEIISRFLGSL